MYKSLYSHSRNPSMISMLIEQFFMYCNQYPSILTVQTLAIQNYINMAPFLVRM